jgi:hypothetical protein
MLMTVDNATKNITGLHQICCIGLSDKVNRFFVYRLRFRNHAHSDVGFHWKWPGCGTSDVAGEVASHVTMIC